jgi:hypothetical protein
MERHIEVIRTVRPPLEEVVRILRDRPGAVLTAHPAPDDGATYHTELLMNGPGGSSVHQEVLVRLRPRRRAADDPHDSWAIEWEPTGQSHLLPSFQGTLEASAEGPTTSLRLSGTYHPPLGAVGAVSDGLIGHRLASHSVESFLTAIALRVESEFDDRTREVGVRPAPYPIDLRERVAAPETWLG